MLKESLILDWFVFLAPAIFIICVIHAYKYNKKDLNLLIAGTLFGYFLEFSSIKLFDVYFYNANWPLNPWQLPLTVSVSWANFIYGAKLLVDSTDLQDKFKPLAMAIFATTLDWGMDPVAVRAKMWTWTINNNPHGYDQQYFGIPWANYFGWITAVMAFTYAYGYCEKKEYTDRLRVILITFIGGVVGAGIVNGIFNFIFLQGKPTNSGGRWVTIQAVVVLSIYFAGLVFLVLQKSVFTSPRGWMPAITFLGNMLSYFAIGLINGYFTDNLFMALIFVVSLLIQCLYTLPFLKFRENST